MFAPPDAADHPTRCEEFYGLSTRPFSLTPDLRFIYQSQSHTRAFEQVTEALRQRVGLIVITGEIGTGKTMLCRALLETFHEARTFLSVILDPFLTVDDLLYQVLADFGVIERVTRPDGKPVPEAARHQLVTTLQQFLASLIPLNAHAVIMIDEAQHLTPPVLEQIRLLSNFETENAKLLQIVLVGQPDLDTMLQQPELRALNQRIARRVELHALSDDEVSDYIARRLSVASATPALFTPSAIREVQTISKGIPRIVNTLCDRALELGCERGKKTVDEALVVEAADRLRLTVPAEAVSEAPAAPLTSFSNPRTLAVAAILVAVALGVWMWAARPRSAPIAAQTAPATPASPARTAPAPPPPPAEPSITKPSETPAREPGSTAATRPSGVAPAASPDASGYRIAVAAFRTSKRAIDVASDIAAKGLPVATHLDTTGQWYQVVVGPFATAEAAANAQRTLAREGYGELRVTPPPDR